MSSEESDHSSIIKSKSHLNEFVDKLSSEESDGSSTSKSLSKRVGVLEKDIKILKEQGSNIFSAVGLLTDTIKSSILAPGPKQIATNNKVILCPGSY